MQRKIIPGVISGEQNLLTKSADCTVKDAVAEMSAKKVGAILVVKEDRLAGIFTERDVMIRVLNEGVDTATTTLAEVMTANPDTLAPDDTAQSALELMQTRRYRHLPVVDGDKIVGMVSVRDLFSSVLAEVEEDLRSKEKFIFGGDYGAA